jgi:hypothetical protein
MFSNGMYDAFWDVPLNYNNFNLYLNDKYSANAESNNQTVLAYTQSTIYDYLLITNTYDSVSQETTTQTLVIDEDTYNATPPSDVQTAIFDDGTYTTVTTTTEIQYIYDYELQTNESKRSVSLINSSYANNLEKQFLLLMR